MYCADAPCAWAVALGVADAGLPCAVLVSAAADAGALVGDAVERGAGRAAVALLSSERSSSSMPPSIYSSRSVAYMSA